MPVAKITRDVLGFRMRDDANLLAGIIAQPDDDAPRLIYADWLDEQGDTDRAEFIRVQIQLARTPWGHPDAWAIRQRNSDLLGEFQLEWAKPVLDAGAHMWNFERGFLHLADLPLAEFVQHGDRLIQHSTIRKILGRGHVDPRRLCACAAAWHLTTLITPDIDDDAMAEALAHETRLTSLRSLGLGARVYSEARWRQLCASPHLQGVEELHAAHTGLELSLPLLEEATFRTRLKRLHYGDQRQNMGGLFDALTQGLFPNLRELYLCDLVLSERDLRQLADAPLPFLHTMGFQRVIAPHGSEPDYSLLLGRASLRCLQLGQSLTIRQIDRIVRAVNPDDIERVYIDPMPDRWLPVAFPIAESLGPYFELRCAQPKALAFGELVKQSPHMVVRGPGSGALPQAGPVPEIPSLAEYWVDLEGRSPPISVRQRNDYRPLPTSTPPTLPTWATVQYTAMERFTDWPVFFRVHLSDHGQRLSFWADREMNDARLTAMAENPALANIQELDLGGTSISRQGLQHFLTSPHLRRLRSLRLSFIEQGDDFARIIADAPVAARLATLKLSFCGVSDRGAFALSKSPYLKRLTTLKLWGGTIGDDGAKALARSPTLIHLRGLRLRENHIGEAGAFALAHPTVFPWLLELNITGNPIGDEGMAALTQRYGSRLANCVGEFEPLPD